MNGLPIGDYALLSGGQKIAIGGTLADVMARLVKMIRYRQPRLEKSS